MSEFDSLMVDELRREFRRTRPPAKALQRNYHAGIFRITDPYRIGFRVFWYPATVENPDDFTLSDTRFELLEII